MYNQYVEYKLTEQPYINDDQLFNVFAAECNKLGSRCKTVFAYQNIGGGRYPEKNEINCIIDSGAYTASTRALQCGVDFSGRVLAYEVVQLLFGGKESGDG